MNLKNLSQNLQRARKKLLDPTFENAQLWIESDVLLPTALESLNELMEREAWDELNNRFYKKIELGTAGMRGRTIGQTVTRFEKTGKEYLHPAVGSAYLNEYNVIWATVGLYRYCREHLEHDTEFFQRPRLVVAHDTRYFSRYFCEYVASTWVKLGGDVYIFDGPRSTPQLSFSVRYLKTVAGIMITASHNPFHDNGYKIYFKDGAQVCGPHGKGIMRTIQRVHLSEIKPFLQKNLEDVNVLSPMLDQSYIECVKEVILDEKCLKFHKPKIVFTPLHGTGAITVVPLLRQLEWNVTCVEKQMIQDPDFPSVPLPNPEYPEVFKLGIKQADAIDSSVVLATDPDADRMGVAVKDETGTWITLNGNTIAVLLADYRVKTMVLEKWLPLHKAKPRFSAAIIKSFVTTPMLDTIAKAYRLKVVDTLTGFKWIGAKLAEYEAKMWGAVRRTTGMAIDYDKTSVKQRKRFHLRHGCFCVFGGEESHGYLANDRVRDKDANASVLMFCELLSFLKAQEISLLDHLDSLYHEYGYFAEDLIALQYEGAAGVQ
ncbi:MAG: phospho-sugar mutase, partial [Puniceicoccales bacterium]|nr:phospho-sugar mutase [Puniceicoccales bacterium]